MYTAAVLTVSDRCFRGQRPDEAGPMVVSLLKSRIIAEQNITRMRH